MKLIKIFIFSLALCLMACAVSAEPMDSMKSIIPDPNALPNHENTHGLFIEPRVNEAHQVDIESHMMQLHNEASSIQTEVPQIHVEDITHEVEPPEDEGVTVTITFDNTPPAALGTEQLQTQLEILGAC